MNVEAQVQISSNSEVFLGNFGSVSARQFLRVVVRIKQGEEKQICHRDFFGEREGFKCSKC